MKHIASLIVVLLLSFSSASQGIEMSEYQQEIMNRRVAEARVLWNTMESEGFTPETVAALDFVFFSNSENEAKELIEQLSENYSLELTPASEKNYILIQGTTRPYGNEFTFEQWLSWVEFMVSVGFSHNAVFSTWSVYAPSSKTTWSSESIEVQ
ncbi:MAG: hypothetical protein ACJA05_001472 [Porticoccus sp.]|jgi:hypothetical protein|uniref:hypothetical protein n=1 Tax=Porticoccus sp. TaxID=2024853 RepID=UPI0039E6D9F1|tara:strand:+ start:245602 stop:246063 length:462 start_codon:yes stop_codon:yes gene_type:complete